MRIKLENEKRFLKLIATLIIVTFLAGTQEIIKNRLSPSAVFADVLIVIVMLISCIYLGARNFFTESYVEIDSNGITSLSVSTKKGIGKEEKLFFPFGSIDKICFYQIEPARDKYVGVVFNLPSNQVPLSDSIISRVGEDCKKTFQTTAILRPVAPYEVPSIMVVYPKPGDKKLYFSYKFMLPRENLEEAMRFLAELGINNVTVQSDYKNYFMKNPNLDSKNK